MYLCIYRVFHDCQCRYSVAVWKRARICIYVYTECSMIASVGILLQSGKEQEYVFMYIQGVP